MEFPFDYVYRSLWLPSVPSPTSSWANWDTLTGTNTGNPLVGNFGSTPDGFSLAQNIRPLYAITTESQFRANGSGDYDGEPLNPHDDALIHAGKGFTLNGNPTLPVKRDAQGNPLRDSAGRLIPVDRAVTVAAGYNQANISGNRYANLAPPQVVQKQIVNVPAYTDILQQELARRTPTNAVPIAFNTAQSPLNTAADWTRRFPTGGTATQPTVVRVTNGGLNIPANATLNHTVIIVEQGDINFNGSGHTLNNVVLVANNGNINLNNIRSTHLSAIAAGSVNMNGGARFSGSTLLANGNRNGAVNFNGATQTIGSSDNLRVFAQGDITYNGATDTRGAFITAKNFTYNGASVLYGSIGAKGDITFNGQATIVATTIYGPDSTPPQIALVLNRDTAPNSTTNDDRITFDPTIIGVVRDVNGIASFRAGINNMPTGQFVNVLGDRQADGLFSFSRSRLEQIYGRALPDGQHTLYLQAQDENGNLSDVVAYTFTLDTTVAAPSQLRLTLGSDSGQSDSDRITRVTTPVLRGMADPNTAVQVFDNGQLVGQSIASSDGTWQLMTLPLTNGAHSLVAIAGDIAGNVSQVSQPLEIVVDAVKPQLSVTTPLETQPLKNGARLVGAIDGTGSAVTSLSYRFNDRAEVPLTLNGTTGGFDQAFDFTGLTNGVYTLTISSVDTAGNTRISQFSVRVILDETAPVITGGLLRDTAPSNTTNGDRITFDPTITGTLTDESQIVSFRAGLNGTMPEGFVDVLAQRQADGRFTFDLTQLDLINRQPLPDGSHTLKLQAKDEYGNLSEVFTLPFVLDRVPPEVLVNLRPQDDSDQVGDYRTKVSVVTLVGQTEPGATVLLRSTGTTATADAQGRVEFAGVNLNVGENRFELLATDIAGNEKLSTVTIERLPVIVLLEESNFTPNKTVALAIPNTPSLLQFKITPQFDRLTLNAIKDAFEVALVDSEGNSLVHTIATGKDSFFNWSEGEAIDAATGVSYDEATGVVTLNLTGIAPQSASIVFRLVNNDGDTTTQVQIEDLTVISASNGVLAPTIGGQDSLPLGASQPNFNQLGDLSSSVQALYGQTSFNEDLKLLYAEIALKNSGTYSTNAPLLVAVKNISDPTVQVRQADGFTPDGLPYYDFSHLVRSGKLDPNNVSDERSLVFFNPNEVQFTYQLVVLGQVNVAPEITTQAGLEVIAGKPYRYDVNAIDSNQDTLTYQLVSAPQGMAIDPVTGVIEWNTTIANLGDHVVKVEVSDGRGGWDEQVFTLSVIDAPPNRPPVFTSTPIVDARVVRGEGSRIIVAHDEWTLSTHNFVNTPEQTTQFVKNIANYFTGGKSGAFLAYTNNFGATSPQLAQAFRSLGHQWTNTTNFNFTLETLKQYDGIFVGGFPANNQVLIDYVKNGGNVYLFAGTATIGSAADEARAWESFLKEFGLKYNSPYNSLIGVIPIDATPHPIFEGINRLYQENGNTIVDLDLADDRGVIVARSTSGQGLYAVYDPNFSTANSYKYDADATDADQDVLTYNLMDAPQGMWIDPATGVIRWSPTAQQVGLNDVSVKVTDTKGAFAFQDFKVLVQMEKGNNAPMIFSEPRLTAYTTQTYRYQVQAIDPNEDNLTYALIAAPSGMQIDSATGIITWTTPALHAEPYEVSVRVTDGRGGVDIQTFNLNVIAPSGQIRGSIFNDTNGDGKRFQTIGNTIPTPTVTPLGNGRIQLSNSFTQLEVAGGLAYNGLVPRDGYYTVTDRTFNTTPTWSVDPVLRLADGSVVVLSNAWNQGAFGAPQYIGDGIVRNTSTFKGISIQADTELIGSGVKTTFSFSTQPGVSLDGGAFVFYAENDIRGIFNLADYAGSIAGGDLMLFQYSSNMDYTVQMAGKALEGSTLNLFGAGLWTGWGRTLENGQFESVLSSDGSNFVRRGDLGLALGFNLSGNTARLVINYDSQPTPPDPALANRLVYIDANRNGLRETTEQFTLTDTQGNYAFTNLTPGQYLVVQETQAGWVQTAPPTLTYDVTLTEGQLLNGLDFANILELGSAIEGVVFKDDDGNRTQGAIEAGLAGALVYLDVNQNGQRDGGEKFTLTNAQGQYRFADLRAGAYTIALAPIQGQQTNPIGQTYSVMTQRGQTQTGFDFGLTKSISDNQPPRFNWIYTPTVQVGERLQNRLAALDPEGDPLCYDLLVAPEGMTVDPLSGTILWEPGASQIGSHEALLRVRDDQGGQDILQIPITVQPFNAAPQFVSTPPRTSATLNRTFQYQAIAQDPEGEAITYRIESSDPTATIDPTTGVITWTPSTLSTGRFTVYAIDASGRSNSQFFRLPVVETNPNDPPVITSQPRTITRPGSTYFYQVQATDPDGDRLSYTLDSTSRAKGMTIDNGVLQWTPSAAQAGAHNVLLEVSDGQGGSTQQSFTLNVTNQAINNAPSITSVPKLVTSFGREYQYNLTGQDSDGDALLWMLDQAPTGMVIDPVSGALRWNPTIDQIGTHEVSVRLIDAQGSYVGQTFSLSVNGTNLSPQFVSAPPTRAAKDQPYVYQPIASDPEGDRLTFSLNNRPAGMAIDPNTGTIRWTPTADQIGSHGVEIVATDAQGATSRQSYAVVVQSTAINQAPVIQTQPQTQIPTGQAYTYQMQAIDPNGDALVYEILSKPSTANLTIDSATGLLRWDNPTIGQQAIVVGVRDSQGLGTAQSFTLNVRNNQAPTIQSQAVTTAIPGSPYVYDVIARDPEGDRLSYSLNPEAIAQGVTIDSLGRLRWTPTASLSVNPLPLTVSVTDAFGASTQQSFNLNVVADTEKPKVNLIASTNRTQKGTEVTFWAQATDNVGIANVQLMVGGQPVLLDARGTGKLLLNQVGLLTAQATAIDRAGNQGNSAALTLEVFDPTATFNPSVTFDLPEVVTAPTQFNVSGEGVTGYRIDVTSVSTGETKMLVGDRPLPAGGQVRFDPSLLQNDSYDVQLTLFGANGDAKAFVDTVSVEGDLKLGNFRLSFTDLSIPVSGIPITVVRTYDSLTSNTSDDFGYGWRLEFRDTDLRTGIRRNRAAVELGLDDVALRQSDGLQQGTKVHLTLPGGGKRESFSFQPKNVVTRDGVNLGPFAARIFEPTFVAESDATSTLTIKPSSGTERLLFKDQSDDKKFIYAGYTYDPAQWGDIYVLTTKEGTVYEIDSKTGDLLQVTDTNGNTLTYSDNAITSSTGTSVTFERDAQGRIVKVTDPMGKSIRYGYDPVTGDLISILDRDNNLTTFKYDTTDQNGDRQVDRPHYLKEIIDPLGRPAVRTEYDENGRLKQMIDAKGQPISMVYDTDNSLQQVKDQYGNTTTYLYDDRGNVLTEIDAEGKTTKRIYDDRNNVLSETVISDRSDDNPNDTVVIGFTTKYTYNAKNDRLTEETGIITRYIYDAQGNERIEETPGQQQQIAIYGDRGRILSETNPLGQTTTYQYEGNNLTQTKDAAGKIITYAYDSRTGLLTSFADANQQTTRFGYSNRGYLEWMQDANGNVVQYINDGNGNRTQEKRTVTRRDGTKQDLMTTWKYSDSGKLEWVKDAEEQTTTYKYDGNGNQIEVIDALNRSTKYRYSKQGQLIETILPDATPTDDRDNSRTIDLYDKGGRRRASIDQAGKMTHFVYDKVGRLVETIYADGRDTLTDLVQSIAPGQPLSAIDWTEVTYIDGVPSFLSDNDRSKTEYYNDGLVKAQIDERGNRTQYRYDAFGRLVKTIFADKTPHDLSDNPTSTIVYDRAGRKEAEIDALQHKTTFKYDEVGRLVETLFHNNTAIKTGYDSLGRRTSVNVSSTG